MLRSTGFRGSGPRSRVQAVLFEKALTLSDTSHLGRIVLPKVRPATAPGSERRFVNHFCPSNALDMTCSLHEHVVHVRASTRLPFCWSQISYIPVAGCRLTGMFVAQGCAEKYLPPMDEKEGRPIVIEDNYGARWCFRYRYDSTRTPLRDKDF